MIPPKTKWIKQKKHYLLRIESGSWNWEIYCIHPQSQCFGWLKRVIGYRKTFCFIHCSNFTSSIIVCWCCGQLFLRLKGLFVVILSMFLFFCFLSERLLGISWFSFPLFGGFLERNNLYGVSVWIQLFCPNSDYMVSIYLLMFLFEFCSFHLNSLKFFDSFMGCWYVLVD